MLNLTRLRHAVALGREQNFARAADVLHLSQPALTRSIQTLERELGVKLFDRQSRRTVPTAFGLLVLEHADEMLRRADQMKRDLKRMTTLATGELRVGSGPYPARTTLGPALAEMFGKSSRFQVLVTLASAERLKELLLKSEIDLYIGDHTAEHDPRLEVSSLKERKPVLYCRVGHPLAKQASLRTADILRYPLGYPHPRRDQEEVGRALVDKEPVSAEHRTRIIVDDIGLLISMVRNSDCVGFGTPDAIIDEVRSGQVAILPYSLPSVFGSAASIVSRRGATASPLARAFITAVKQHDASEFIFERGAIVAASD